MLHSGVRSFNRSIIYRCHRSYAARAVHFTRFRSIDDKNVGPKNTESTVDEASSTTSQESAAPPEANEDSPSPPIREPVEFIYKLRDLLQKDQDFPESHSSFVRPPSPADDEHSTESAGAHQTLTDEERLALRRTRIEEYRKWFGISDESLDDKYRQNIRRRKKEDEDAKAAANREGLRIFEEINRRRKEQGKRPLFYLESPEEIRRGSREMSARRKSSTYESRTEEDEDVSEDNSMTMRQALEFEYLYPSKFDPSKAIFQGLDEVDVELGYEFTSFPSGRRRTTRRVNPDGTIIRDKKNVPPDDAAFYIEVNELGPTGDTFYKPDLLQRLMVHPEVMEEEIENRIRKETFPETTEQDLDELLNIYEDFEEGYGPRKRLTLRREREVQKEMRKIVEMKRQGVNLGLWGQKVPMPKAYLPETEHLDDYVPPTFSTESFRDSVPELPVGVQGRRLAAFSAGLDDTFSLHLPHFTDPLPPELQEQLNSKSPEEIEQALGELEKLVEDSAVSDSVLPFLGNPKTSSQANDIFEPIAEEDPPEFDPRYKGGYPPERPPLARPPTEDDSHRPSIIEHLYSDEQMAVWKEMHKDFFVPPIDDPDPEFKRDGQELSEGEFLQIANARALMDDYMRQMDKALLTKFRRQDEMDIRDIRRRLGLPIIRDENRPEHYYDLKHVPIKQTPESLPDPGAKGDEPTVLKGEIADIETPPAEDTTTIERLNFWRDCKEYLASLTARINQMRRISHETSDRVRRHGVAEVVTAEGSGITTEVLEGSRTDDLMHTLKKQYDNLRKALRNLQIVITAVQLGPEGPLDPEYSARWIEHHLHEDEKAEFERTAVAMGYAPNSLPMEPQQTPELKQQWEDLSNSCFDHLVRIGLAGEYEENGFTVGENMQYPVTLAANYARKAGANHIQQEFLVSVMGRVFHERELEMTDPEQRRWDRVHRSRKRKCRLEAYANEADIDEGEDEEDGIDNELEEDENEDEGNEEDEAAKDEESKEKDKRNVSKTEEEISEPETLTAEEERGLQKRSAGIQLSETVDDSTSPVAVGDRQIGYSKLVQRLRESMGEMDRKISELEETYDAFLRRQSNMSPSVSTKSTTQELRR